VIQYSFIIYPLKTGIIIFYSIDINGAMMRMAKASKVFHGFIF